MRLDALRGRGRYLLAAAVCLAAVGWLVFGQLSENVTYFRTVSEARAERDDGRFRLMGEVVSGSVRETGEGVHFEVTDGAQVAAVVHRGDPPQLFAGGVPVVCEGRWRGEVFESDRIMIRHGNEYRPPNVEQPAGGQASGRPPA